MILQIAHSLSKLCQPGAAHACWRRFSLLHNISSCVPCSAISLSVFHGDVNSTFLGIQSQHIRCRIGTKKILPFRRNNWLFFFSSVSRDVHHNEFGMQDDMVELNCQRGQEILKNFLAAAESGDKKVCSGTLVKTLDDIIAAVYSNGNYPFKNLYNMFQDQSSTGKRGLTGNSGMVQLFGGQSLLRDFFSCAEIEPLLSLINEHLVAMTASQKAHIFLCLNYLGIQEVYANHPVMHKLFYVLTEPAGELGYEDLRKFQMVLETYCNPNIVRYKLLFPHFKHLNSVGFLTGLEKQQFVQAISYNTDRSNMHSMVGNSMHTVHFSQIWHALVTDENIIKCPENIVTVLNHLCSAPKDIIPHIIKNDIFDRIEKKLIEQVEHGDVGLLVKVSAIKKYLERQLVSKKLQLKIKDQWEKILHTLPNLSTVEMLSVMTYYRMENFHLSQDSLGILTRHMEENFPKLQPVYSVQFLSMLGVMIRKHKEENLSHFSKLLTLMNTHSDANMFQNVRVFEKLLMKWKLVCLSSDAFKMYVQLNLLSRQGFGRDRRWLPIVLDCIEGKLDDVTRKDLMERITAVCRGETHLKKLLHICFNLIHISDANIDKSKHTEFYNKVLQLINTKLTDLADLQELAECFSSGLDFRANYRHSVSVKETISNMIERVSKVILLPHSRSDVVLLGESISHHYYNESNAFFHLTTPAVDQLVTNLLKEEQTCGLDCFIALTNLLASGAMSRSKLQECEKFADVLFRENMDSMRIDSLLLGLDNLCLAGVFPKKTLRAVLSSDFLDVVDQCINKKSQRVMCAEHIEYHLLRLNRTVVLDCPELDIPWFCGHVGVEKKSCQKYLIKYYEMTETALCRILGGKEFLSVNSTTRLKHIVDFQCFISSHGHPIRPDRIDMDKPLPADIQKVAIDVLPDILWGNKPEVMYQEKKRHLEKEDYNYIQVKRDCMRGLALSGVKHLEEYYTEKIFR